MRKTTRATLSTIMVLGAAVLTDARAAQFFVAAQGNDKNSGTLDKPFATLQRAQQAARKQRSEDRGQKSEIYKESL